MNYFTKADQFVLYPALILAMFGCAIFLFDFLVFPSAKQKKWLLIFVVIGLAFAGSGLWTQQQELQRHSADLAPPFLSAFQGSLIVDGLSIFFNWIFLAATFIVAIVSYKYLEIEDSHQGEYYGLMMLANCGMFFLATGADLITLFIGLETMALCFYILVGFLRKDKRSNEAAMKYLILGAFSSGFLAYGFSILYGIAGSTKLKVIAAAVSMRDPWDPMVLLALATAGVGLLFKVSAVPFHMWAPDAYEGAPTTVTAYLSVASKAASIAFLVRIFMYAFGTARVVWGPMLGVIAVLTLTVGNLGALSQNNVKRLLAYSSISHAGYMLLGLVAGNETGIKGIAVYVMVYTFMNLGAFMVIISLRRRGILGEDIEDLSGLMHKSPVHALLMLVFMMSLAGIPPAAGFLGKYYIVLALVQSQQYTLAVIAVLYVAIAVYYYFRIVRSMFVSEVAEKEPVTSSFGLRVALAVTGLMTVLVGVYPEPFLRLTQLGMGH